MDVTQSLRQPIQWFDRLEHFGESAGLPPTLSTLLTHLSLLLTIFLLGWFITLIARRIVIVQIEKLASKTATTLDDDIVQAGLFHRLVWVIPPTLIYLFAPVIFHGTPLWQGYIERICHATVIWIGAFSLLAFINALNVAYGRLEVSKVRPIKSYLQLLRLVIYLAAVIVAVSALIDRSPWLFLSGLGAMTAVLLLIFRDTILGLVASIQIAAYDLVRIGDWIELPKYGADGEVKEISLSTVKVRNWDNTISMIPAYAIVSESLKNWRAMSESGGRRIKRHLLIDAATIRFLGEDDIEHLKRLQLLEPYLNEKQDDLAESNKNFGNVNQNPNARRLTNIGTFRAYVLAYLKQHPDIRQDMSMIVRQLAPTSEGIPLEIYVFSAQTSWVHYEAVQSDIFDHLLAIIDYFDLAIMHIPSGRDIRGALNGRQAL